VNDYDNINTTLVKNFSLTLFLFLAVKNETKKLSFNKCWTQEHGMAELFFSYKYCFGVKSLGSKINRSVGQQAASAEAERLVLSFRNP